MSSGHRNQRPRERPLDTVVPSTEEASGFTVLHAHKPEVDDHRDVLLDPRLLHLQVAEDLIHLENDCSFCLVYIGFQRLLMRDQGQELVCNAIRRGWLICRFKVQNKDNKRRLFYMHNKAGIHSVECDTMKPGSKHHQ
jgi:hypothetical protein